MPERGSRQPRGGSRAPGPRPFWSGTISFGLVSVPVDLYPANRAGGTPLRMLAPDGRPVQRVYVCPAEEREVSGEELVRGHELDSGGYVAIDDEELEALAPEKSREIDLRSFVPRESIPALYFERAYYLVPSGDSVKAYRLLAQSMERAERAGIATFVMRGREYLVAIVAEGGILRAETLRFADEVRSPEAVGLPEPASPPAARSREVARAVSALHADELDSGELRDERSARIRELASAKREGDVDVVETPAVAEATTDMGKTIDIMEALERSLARRDGGRRTRRAGGASGGEISGPADRLAGLSRDELYRRAQVRDIPGRSSMTKRQLIDALSRPA